MPSVALPALGTSRAVRRIRRRRRFSCSKFGSEVLLRTLTLLTLLLFNIRPLYSMQQVPDLFADHDGGNAEKERPYIGCAFANG